MAHPAVIVGWARSAVAPHGGALRHLTPHALGAPVLQALLARSGVPAGAVDAVVLGNALGAGGNPARMVALAAGLPDRCAALTVDTQCCAGLDAVSLGVGLLAAGQAEVVVAGGVEAWSRAPIRQHRPLTADEPPVPYERPAFAPDPARDPDLLEAAARHALAQQVTRAEQDAYAMHSHARARDHAAGLPGEIVPVAGLACDAHPRALTLARAARMPVVAEVGDAAFALSPLAISPRADGCGLVLLATPAACRRLGLTARAAWRAGVSIGAEPEMPLRAAALAAQTALARLALDKRLLAAIELHDAFAVQGLDFRAALGVDDGVLNRRGGGLARGHPIGASAAIALVRLLTDLAHDHTPGALGLAAVAGAGGLGAAAVVERL
ncbi:MAG: Acetyl-CoA acetyltransferase [Paracidovorax wautersii]|uniref:Acetyl-CoA acetyltransferase n=1 Tax=Paracidovorax wautersii TaxID=1177982 RepID=A0A7V8JP07_9BURK|nr:MAG: Acetyl-CoA acetyltransferase [Paracidovorax wautersii]